MLAVLVGAQMAVLAFPQVFFNHSARVGAVTIYTDAPGEIPLDSLAIEVDRYLQVSTMYDSTGRERAFVFESERFFHLFARLSFQRPDIQGFCLTVFGNSFINASRVRRAGDLTGRRVAYSITEESLVHVIVHEITHDYLADIIGRSTWKKLPLWKQEGYCEYVANITAIRDDSLESPAGRIGILHDDSIWGRHYGHDRRHYEAELLWEYLLDIKGYSIPDIVSDTVTREDVLREMTEWCKTRLNGLHGSLILLY